MRDREGGAAHDEDCRARGDDELLHAGQQVVHGGGRHGIGARRRNRALEPGLLPRLGVHLGLLALFLLLGLRGAGDRRAALGASGVAAPHKGAADAAPRELVQVDALGGVERLPAIRALKGAVGYFSGAVGANQVEGPPQDSAKRTVQQNRLRQGRAGGTAGRRAITRNARC